ncbi:hypothetical protein AN958_03620 [Leucoagaricus sp. SymC.cos]|nr:hypothetical protein AN958_03620 [Leucoagaricus sp. SymC.cos]
MPRNSQSQSSSNRNSSSRSGGGGGTTNNNSRSDYSYYKDFGGYYNFMHSYGLKPYDDNDVQEGKAIIEAFREHDSSEAQEGKGK